MFWGKFFSQENIFLNTGRKNFGILSETFAQGCPNCILRGKMNILGFLKQKLKRQHLHSKMANSEANVNILWENYTTENSQ